VGIRHDQPLRVPDSTRAAATSPIPYVNQATPNLVNDGRHVGVNSLR
jgi:hypothetical protein